MPLESQMQAIATDLAPLRTFDGERWSEMDGGLVTVVCREGRVVSTADEHQFFPAWRYSNHMTAAFDGDIFAVTPHGWTGTLSEACGLVPALQPTD
ncbi:hypothetical protein MWU75_10385 [Ornithinimicrobium sp. F0845]|uniref:hypothetical protein n=1 Tax=Ornithinimicrobium sp. F0845 TaxID=2926412 RepID=UPI001FF5654A|nr:hypothetical protein [Ornithinimicrobium sp. F0845]MCK0112546.1 hypothetical protein [Ornithinimicrobium sp. F0845]